MHFLRNVSFLKLNKNVFVKSQCVLEEVTLSDQFLVSGILTKEPKPPGGDVGNRTESVE